MGQLLSAFAVLCDANNVFTLLDVEHADMATFEIQIHLFREPRVSVPAFHSP
jgi:hypothetical protein